MKKSMLVLMSGLISLTASAVDAIWSNTTATYPTKAFWPTSSNWSEGVMPSSADDAVMITPLTAAYGKQIISTGCTWAEPTAANIAIDSISGDARHVILHTDTRSMGMPNTERVFQVRDPNGFAGYWETSESWATFRLMAGPQFVPELSNLRTTYRPFVEVPDAGTVASVETLYGGGSLQKTGPGELVVKCTSGYDSRIYAVSGTVTLAGVAAGDSLSVLLEKASFHLDASQPDAFVFADDGTSITNWFDVRKNGLSARRPPDGDLTGRGPSYVSDKNLGLPFISTQKSPSGLSYVDFGSRTPAGASNFGPTNCLMKLPGGLSIREAFYVVRYHESMEFNPVLGDSGRMDFFPGGGGALFGGSTARAVANGDLRVNGQRVEYFYALGTEASVVSIGTLDEATSTLLGCSDYYCDRSGGFMLGELILFDRPLARSERLRIDGYLRDKWLRKGANVDELAVGQLILAADGASVGVPTGATAGVADLVTMSANVVKTGAGTLAVDRVSPPDVTIDVQGGDVRFKRLTASVSANPQPAEGAYIHLDATANLETYQVQDDAKKYVRSWGDVRPGVNRSAVAPTELSAPRHPFVVSNAAGEGLDAISFGDIGGSWMKFPSWDSYGSSQVLGEAYAGFMVLKFNSEGSYIPLFGSSNSDMMRNDGDYHGRLLSSTYAGPTAAAALWTIDGTIVDPWEYRPQDLRQTSRFIVVGFSGSEPCRVDGIAKLRASAGYANECGGIQVGEMIVYNRPISDLERRDTEAYLLKKWLGKDHPFTGPQTVTFAFAEGIEPVIDTEGDMTVARVQGGTGDVVKRGAGAVEVDEPICVDGNNWKSISVEGGELVVSVPGEPDDGAYYHFDASAIETMTYTVDGGKTNVSVWADADGRDICATNITTDYVAGGAPRLKGFAFQDGKTRNGLDFGAQFVDPSSSAMWMDKSFENLFKEGIAVYQSQGTDYRTPIFSTTNQKLRSGTVYMRGDDGQLSCSSDYTEVYKDWYAYDFDTDKFIFTDGSYALKDNLPHLVNTVPQGTGQITIDAIAFQQIFGGGLAMFEQVGFTNRLSAARRDWWQRHLAYKWFGQGVDPVWTNCYLSAVSVAADATLTLTGGANPLVATLSGAGTVNATALQGVESLTFDIGDVANGDALMVNGAVTFADAVHVTVGGSDAIRLSVGNYTLLETSKDLGDLDLSSWTIDVSELSEKRTYAVRQIGNRIVLSVQKKGMAVIVR